MPPVKRPAAPARRSGLRRPGRASGARRRARPELDRRFFAAHTLVVARRLLGCTLSFGGCEGVIVETEAYTTDQASHFHTRRHQGRPLAETYGQVYVYLNYGMYHLLNFTTDRAGVGAVLVRAVEPTAGLEEMMARRGTRDVRRLASGPGKLCRAFGIDLGQHGEEVGRSIHVYARTRTPRIAAGPRVGISRDTHLPWRFFVAESAYVSRHPARSRHRERRRAQTDE